jgi:hypothetical protein
MMDFDRPDYEFYVFEWEEIVWMYDDNERTFVCSFRPSIYARPIYTTAEEDEGMMDNVEPKYFDPDNLPATRHAMTLPSVMDEEEAWEEAMEEVSANHPL